MGDLVEKEMVSMKDPALLSYEEIENLSENEARLGLSLLDYRQQERSETECYCGHGWHGLLDCKSFDCPCQASVSPRLFGHMRGEI